jgi:nitronate monooxygenase
MSMHHPPNRQARDLVAQTTLPVVGAPLFLISNPKLVIAQCCAGIIGSFPALNAREEAGEPIMLENWLQEITEKLDKHNQTYPDAPAAPFAVNLIVHKSNSRLERDVEILAKWKVPVWITSLGAREFVNEAAHQAGGMVLHDVIHNRFAKKAIEKGADGLIAVAAGAGGHAGRQSPFALIQEIRSWFAGPLLLSGAIATGHSILAARAMGADMAYIGSPFIACAEAQADSHYKQMILDSGAEDILYTDYFTGVHGNYLRNSIRAQGLDPDNLPDAKAGLDYSSGQSKPKSWKQIWGAGQGIGVIQKSQAATEFIDQLRIEYQQASEQLSTKLLG